MENQLQSSFSVLMVGLPYLEGIDFLPYIQSLVIFITLALLFKLFHKLVLVRLKKLSNETKTSIDNMVVDTLGKIKSWAYTYVAFYLALLPLAKPDLLHTILTAGLLLLVVWQLIELATCFINYGINFFLQKDQTSNERGKSGLANTTGIIALLTKLVLWSFGGLFILSNLGVDVTSLIAGFGVSGIAVALALKNIFQDLFSSLSIYFDKPFQIGDHISVGKDSGVVKKIGMKTSRLQTEEGEELVISNSDLTKARVRVSPKKSGGQDSNLPNLDKDNEI